METKPTAKYLGIKIYSNMSFGEDIRCSADKAARGFSALGKHIPNKGCPWLSKRRQLFYSFNSVLLYWSWGLVSRAQPTVLSFCKSIGLVIASSFCMPHWFQASDLVSRWGHPGWSVGTEVARDVLQGIQSGQKNREAPEGGARFFQLFSDHGYYERYTHDVQGGTAWVPLIPRATLCGRGVTPSQY